MSTVPSYCGRPSAATSSAWPTRPTPSTWVEQPLDEGERALSQIADWGPAEDWSDWADAPEDHATG